MMTFPSFFHYFEQKPGVQPPCAHKVLFYVESPCIFRIVLDVNIVARKKYKNSPSKGEAFHLTFCAIANAHVDIFFTLC